MINKKIQGGNFSVTYMSFYWIFFFILWIFYGLNTWTVDSVSYQAFYNVFVSGGWFTGVEYGFALFMSITARMGLSYQQFLMIYSFIGLLLIAITLKRVAKRPLAVLFLFFMFPFAHEVSALRNFMAMAITFWGTQYLVNDNFRGNIKFFLSILCATMFHTSAFIYLLLFLGKLDKRKINFIAIIVLTVELVLVLSNTLVSILPKVIPKTAVYLESGFSGTQLYTKVLFVFYFAIIIYITRKLYKLTLKDIEVKKLSTIPKYAKYSELVYKVMPLTVLFYPIILFDVDFYRLARNLLLMFYVMATNITYFNTEFVTTKRKLVILIYVSIFILCLVFFFLILFSFESVLLPVFQNNLIFDLFK